jgi:photosystem II stability/assembly factor-like uncharacterized protein
MVGDARVAGISRSPLIGGDVSLLAIALRAMRRAPLARCALFLFAALLPLLGASVPAFAQNPGFHAVYSRDGIDAWAVGDGGVYYRSFDGGLTWGMKTLGSSRLRDVVARGLVVTVVGDSGKIWRSTNSGGAWSVQVIGGTPDLRAISMPTDLVGFVVGGGGRILKTVDGGGSWTPKTSGTANRLNAVHFVDPMSGWVAGENGTLLATFDGGDTWTPAASGTTRELYSVMQRGLQVWAVGAFGTALKSTNGGASIEPVDLKLDAHADVRCVWLQSPDSVYLVGGGGFIRRSADGGLSWTFAVHNMHGQISDIFFAGATGLVVSNKNRLPMSSIDRGNFWRFPTGASLGRAWEQRLAAGAVYGNTFATNPHFPGTIYCAISSGIWRTLDEGETWLRIASFPGNPAQTNAFIVSPKDTNVWFAAIGLPKRLVKSDDYGQSWFTMLTHDYGNYGVPVEYDHDHPDTLYFGGDSDVLYRTIDGKNWEPWSTTPFRSPCDIAVVPDSSHILIVADGVTTEGQAQYFKSVDGGRTFQLKYQRPPGATEIPELAVSRLRPNTIFGTNWGGGGVQRSIDFGETWPNVSNTASAWGVDIARDDPNVVMFGTYSGFQSYLSLDGGTSFAGTSLNHNNYSFYLRDRGTILAEQGNGIYKMRFFYDYTPADTQRVTVTAPNGGEVWEVGSTYEITWTASRLALAAIDVRQALGEPWTRIAEVPGYEGRYQWTVSNLPSSEAKIRVSDAWDAAPSDSSNATFMIVSSLVGVDPARVPTLALRQNRPNPFTGATRIGFSLPTAAKVALEVFDLQGQRVATLASGPHSAGEHTVEFGAGVRTTGGQRLVALRAGVYYYRLTADTRSITRKMLYLP